ncbi:MAG: hypothetical protein ABW135_01695 [Thermoleophilaceae bacterium]
MDVLPHWERGTPAILCVAGPHAIPMSTTIRAGDHLVLFALGRDRETLQRLRDDSRAAICVIGKGLAFTANGYASVVAERLESSNRVVAVELRVEIVQDHLADGRTEILDGVRWRWLDEKFGESEDAVVAELQKL